MAVRNLAAIQRQGSMIAEQETNQRNMVEENFWRRVDIIKKCHDDAVDFVDTVNALTKNGLRTEFEKWLQNQNIGYTNYNETLQVKCLSECKERAYVYYSPKEDVVEFGWNGYGMMEHYSTERNTDYLIHTAMRGNHRHYDEGLTMLATRLQPFLNNFFKWVETI